MALIDFDVVDAAAVVTLAAPPLNIFSIEMREELIDVLLAVRDIPDVRALVLRSEGEHFSAGADLKEFGTGDVNLERRRVRWEHDPWAVLDSLTVPRIAAVRGIALGSGFEMAMQCDIRIASQDTRIGLPETILGLLPAAGGTQSVTKAIGPCAALPIVALGTVMRAAEALERGLVDEVVPPNELDDRVFDIATSLAGLDAYAVKGLLRALRSSGDLPLKEGLNVEARIASGLRAHGRSRLAL